MIPDAAPDGFDPRRHQPRADELRGRVIAITGAGDGIGRAVAIACAGAGAEVVLLGRTVRKLEAACDAIEASGASHPVIAPLDLERAVAADYDAVAAAIEQRFGRLDGLLHNAGLLGDLSPIEHYDVPLWCRVMHVNVTAAFALTQVLLPALRASPDASVLFTSSSVGRRGRAYWGAYAASKAAVEGLAEVLADECAGTTHVRVNTINPGGTRTAMRRRAYPSEAPDGVPPPESITVPYVCLLGPASRGVTGRRFDAQWPRSPATSPAASPAPPR
jgi:NAD(P)-dependent dehydrogenase (short-subunit alcohol dehydrogenase family)